MEPTSGSPEAVLSDWPSTNLASWDERTPLHLRFLHEYDVTDVHDGLWRFPPERRQLPLMFSSKASKDT